MPPRPTTAASFVPSDDDVIEYQPADVGRPEACKDHDTPESELV